MFTIRNGGLGDTWKTQKDPGMKRKKNWKMGKLDGLDFETIYMRGRGR